MAKRVNFKNFEHIKMLLYGQPGSTKTRTAATAAWDDRTSPCLMLEKAGNPLSIRDYEKVPDIISVESLEEYNPFYNWLRAGQPVNDPIVKAFDLRPPYKCLVIDGATETQRMSFMNVTNSKNTGPGSFPNPNEIQHFNRVLAQMTNWARLFFELPMHVFITSLEREDRDESTGTPHFKPLLWGQSAGEVAGYAYAVARMLHVTRLDNKLKMALGDELKNNDVISAAVFQPSAKWVAKDQYGCLGAAVVNPSVTKFMDLIFGKQEVE
jgi:hypothetical protein